MNIAEQLHKITDAFNGLYSILDDNDLYKAGLSLSDFRECQRLMPMLGEPGKKACTVCEKAADYFRRKQFVVTKSNKGFEISI